MERILGALGCRIWMWIFQRIAAFLMRRVHMKVPGVRMSLMYWVAW